MRFFFTALLLIVLSASAEAQQIHAILIGDTNDQELGAAFDKNLIKMRGELNRISYYTGLSVNTKEIKGDDVVVKKISQTINQLPVQSDDLVIFYFCSHGYRTSKKKNPWPNFSIKNEKVGLDFEQVNKILIEKNPQFLLSIADCCNSWIPEGYIQTVPLDVGKMVLFGLNFSSVIRTNYRSLFLNTKGRIIVSGSKPYQFSWAYPSYGSVYTLNLLDSISEELKQSTGTNWEIVMDKAQIMTEIEVGYDVEEDIQTPQYQIIYR